MITKKTVDYLADLSKIKLKEREKELLVEDLNGTLNLINKINELSTSDIEETTHVLPIKNVFREDTVRESLDREVILEGAPNTEDGCVKVPKIVE